MFNQSYGIHIILLIGQRMDLHTPQIYRQSNFKKPAILHTSGLKIRDFYALAWLIITGMVTFNSGITIIIIIKRKSYLPCKNFIYTYCIQQNFGRENFK